MTESLSGQFDGMLPGVDWSKYRKSLLYLLPNKKLTESSWLDIKMISLACDPLRCTQARPPVLAEKN